MEQETKPEKQETKSDDKEPQEENPQEKRTSDSDNKSMLISDNYDPDNPQQGAIKKQFFRKKTTGPKPYHHK